MVSDPTLAGDGPIPDSSGRERVWTNERCIVVKVRHAQDGIESFADDFVWSSATVSLRLWEEPPSNQLDSTVLFEGHLQTPTGRLRVGDADGNAEVEAYAPLTAVRVAVPADDDSPSHAVIDLWEG